MFGCRRRVRYNGEEREDGDDPLSENDGNESVSLNNANELEISIKGRVQFTTGDDGALVIERGRSRVSLVTLSGGIDSVYILVKLLRVVSGLAYGRNTYFLNAFTFPNFPMPTPALQCLLMADVRTAMAADG